MPRQYGSFDEFLDDLDRSGNLSDDPFEDDAPESLDEEDIKLLTGGRRRSAKPKPRRRPVGDAAAKKKPVKAKPAPKKGGSLGGGSRKGTYA